MAEVGVVGLLQAVNSRLSQLDHQMSAVEIAEERRRQESQARADETRHLRSREHLLEVQQAARRYQARVDSALEPWGIRSPGPTLGQPVGDYRRSLLAQAKKQLPEDHQLRRVQVFKLDDSALDAIEPQILTAVKSAAHRPDSVPPGELRAVKEQDQSGRDITKFIGQESFVREFHRPGRFARIRNPNNYYDRPFFSR